MPAPLRDVHDDPDEARRGAAGGPVGGEGRTTKAPGMPRAFSFVASRQKRWAIWDEYRTLGWVAAPLSGGLDRALRAMDSS